MPRDALWVLPSGATTIVTLDDEGNLMEPIPDSVREAPAKAPDPVKAPDPPPPQPHRHRGRRNRH